MKQHFLITWLLRNNNSMRWEDPSKAHLVSELDREILLKWLSMSSLQQFTVWHDTNAIIKKLCVEMLKRLDDEEPPAK